MNVTIKKLSNNNFQASLNSTTFSITVDDDYYYKLTSGKFSKEQLIRASFRFLLDREPTESILRSFNLRVIEKYFPEYPEKIREYLDNL